MDNIIEIKGLHFSYETDDEEKKPVEVPNILTPYCYPPRER